MLDAARATSADRVLVATEVGMLHQLRAANPDTTFDPVNPHAICPFMKQTTPDKLLTCLREGTDEVTVDPAIASRARRAVERMIEIGSGRDH